MKYVFIWIFVLPLDCPHLGGKAVKEDAIVVYDRQYGEGDRC
jgi:hypothetical protein